MSGIHLDSNSILYLNGVSVSFDGFKALNSLSLILEPGELRVIIGPNGAGKTTMMDVITGKVRPDEGEVVYKSNVSLVDFSEAEIANMGIGRKFQKPTVIEPLSVEENLELALKTSREVRKTLFYVRSKAHQERIDEILGIVKLAQFRDKDAGSLSHGQKQWLEIGMLLIQEPEVLLVDEPAAGMTDHETEKTAELLKSLAEKHTIVVVEHDMDFVKALDSKVTVLHEGRVLAEGPLDSVQNNEQVIEVYLGR